MVSRKGYNDAREGQRDGGTNRGSRVYTIPEEWVGVVAVAVAVAVLCGRALSKGGES